MAKTNTQCEQQCPGVASSWIGLSTSVLKLFDTCQKTCEHETWREKAGRDKVSTPITHSHSLALPQRECTGNISNKYQFVTSIALFWKELVTYTSNVVYFVPTTHNIIALSMIIFAVYSNFKKMYRHFFQLTTDVLSLHTCGCDSPKKSTGSKSERAKTT